MATVSQIYDDPVTQSSLEAITKFACLVKYLWIFEGNDFIYGGDHKMSGSQNVFTGLLRGPALKIDLFFKGGPLKGPPRLKSLRPSQRPTPNPKYIYIYTQPRLSTSLTTQPPHQQKCSEQEQCPLFLFLNHERKSSSATTWQRLLPMDSGGACLLPVDPGSTITNEQHQHSAVPGRSWWHI